MRQHCSSWTLNPVKTQALPQPPALPPSVPQAGDFPVAEHAHAHTIKLPVWHREQDLELAEKYVPPHRWWIALAEGTPPRESSRY
ncbi:hypothetical protein [Streptomyces palmae]|uniref:Uncharacterized protein n=1 Tax=Streptomyces palmae TaxID=1701085 RepID=A0A4Z0H823_9ACTN|nr:hypothetical protein [Streptomyces palmae]TGB11631.1 hypothetical protein E4099_11830 [Streptomyces palmae]